ncbi:hypothetical protein [Methanobrevibacter sp.]|uniref:hypothetical protein n=1 Tax=Methanobrevibacter sp. TaxID=66852 RepID=UPI00386FF8C7
MNKKAIVLLAILALIFTCVSISAADLETVDEGNYTISVPAGETFKNVSILPSGISFHLSSNGFMSDIQKAMFDGKLTKGEDLLYYYIDFNKDSVANCSSLNSTDAYMSLIENNTGVEQDSNGSYKVFKYAVKTNVSDYDYVVIVQDQGFLSMFPQERIVGIEGNDLELLTEMADSVKFK